ncbi:SprT family zinc-dependent metalloprotease [Alteromonas facilis]|uniref:SprT family zinc-dependent metalloprotease n=1 Tax=Alteromonas facilis TaxID=2048004 RepID=UPI000C286A82|nr:SprT family zinc-dependent metalloprotease [Alteromonas facilis]
MITDNLKKQINARVSSLILQAESVYNRPLKLPTVGFRRAGKTGGSAHLQKNHINFNPAYLLENLEHYLTQVVPHEVAHIVVWQMHGKVKPHGQEWQNVMREIFCVAPDVTHHMQSTLLKENTVTYACDCGDVELSIRRHNKVKRGQRYQCRRCGMILTQVTK